MDIASVRNFMYHGEVNISQDELNSFLLVAEDIKMKGLTQNLEMAQKANAKETIDIRNNINLFVL